MKLSDFVMRFLLFILLGLLGLISGALLGGRILMPEGSMGWDALANMLSGAFFGALIGLLAAGLGVRKWQACQLKKANLLALSGLILMISLLLVFG